MVRVGSKIGSMALLCILTFSFFTVMPFPHAYAAPTFVQQTASTSNLTCVYATNPVKGDLLIASFGGAPSTATVSSISDSLGNTWTLAKTETQASSSVSLVGWIYTAIQTHTAGADTITVSIGGSPTQGKFTCLEWSGVSQTIVASSTNKGTLTSGTISASVASFTPIAGDMIYVSTFYTTCGSTGTITYDSHYTARTGKGADQATGTNCRTLGLIKAQFNMADQSWEGTTATANTATFSIPSGTTDGVNTRGWLEMEVEFSPVGYVQCASNTAIASSTVTVTLGTNTIVGDVLAVWAGNGVLGTVSTITDTQSNSYSFVVGQSAQGYRSEGWYAPVTTAGADTVTITWSASITSGATVCEIFNAASDTPLSSTGNSASSSSPSVSSFTPDANSFMFAGVMSLCTTLNSCTVTAGSGYTLVSGGNQAIATFRGTTEYNPDSVGAQTCPFTFSVAESFNEVCMAFAPVGSNEAYSATLSPTVGVTALVSRTFNGFRTISPTISVTPTISRTDNAIRTVNPTITAAPTISRTFNGFRTISDTVTVAATIQVSCLITQQGCFPPVVPHSQDFLFLFLIPILLIAIVSLRRKIRLR